MANSIKNYSTGVKNLRTQGTHQRVRTPGRTDEVRNDAGGFVFSVTPKVRLERFLILGTDGGTYYVGENRLTRTNIQFVIDLIRTDEQLVIDVLRDVADNNRAPKSTPSLFVLALLMHEGQNKPAIRALVQVVARTATHLFEYAGYLKDLGGLGRAKRGSLADWYTDKTTDDLAYQAVKYRQRDGWTHRDVMRLAHPKGVDVNVGNFILSGEVSAGAPDVIVGYRMMSDAKSVKDVVNTLSAYPNLPWETIPTQFLTDPNVWKTLFYNGALGQTALIRNVTRLHNIGAFSDLVFAGDVAKALADPVRIAKGRVHPVAYANARGMYGKNVVGPNAKVLGALESGFYESFSTVVPANKPTMIGLDVSGSMSAWAPAGLKGLDCMEAAAIMAMVTIRTEPYVIVGAFDHGFTDVNISDQDSMDAVIRKLPRNYGGTDAALPMREAKARGIDVDGFIVYTDNDTHSGGVKPNKALEQYRSARGRDSRLVVVGMVASDFTIADPTDSGMLDVVGFDSAAPAVISNFLR